MKNTAKKFGLLFIIILVFLLCALAASFSLQKTAYAAGEYSISSWRLKKPLKYYYSATEGCTYIVTVTDNTFSPIQKIVYSAYQVSMNTEDIQRDDDDKITNPFAKDKQGNELNNVELLPEEDITFSESYDQQGYRTGTFEVTAYEWSAYLFSVEYKNGEETLTETGDFLYCTNIDSSKPYISLLGSPAFQDNGYYFEYMVRANEYGADRSANSGLSSVRTYRLIDGVQETIKEYTKFNNELTFYGGLLTTKGEYFIEAIDAVGNRQAGKVIKIDKDLSKVITINAAEDYLRKETEYAPDLIEALRQKYVAWQLLDLDTSAAQDAVTAAYNALMGTLNACSEAKKNFFIRAINTEYVGSITVENFNPVSLPSVVKGESVTMNISLAMFDTAEVDKSEILRLAQLPEADRVLALSIYLSSDLKEMDFTEYAAPVKITVPLSRYRDIAAIAVSKQNGQTVYTKLRLDKGDDWVSVYLPYSDADINLIIDDRKTGFDLRWLYMLFLLVPISGAMLFLFRKRIFKKRKKVPENTDSE